MLRLNGPFRIPMGKRQTDGNSIMVPGWPEQEKRKRQSTYYLRVAWGRRMLGWQGYSNWTVISRVPQRLYDPFRRNGCNCIKRSYCSAMKFFEISEQKL